MIMYDDISLLPIFNYNKIVESSDYKWLLINQNAKKIDQEKLQETWSNIINQYIVAISHREGNQDIYRMQQQVFELSIEYNNIQILCLALKHRFTYENIEKLSEYGYDVECVEDIDNVIKRSKNILTQKRSIEITLLDNMSKSDKSMTFESLLDKISQHQGYRLNPREISVKEWIAIEDNYINDLKKRKNATN